ncbi:MAG: hypothetical protein ALECFALPRED_001659 [Alectoria fallacina]|uniref:Nuclear envelope protein n=1 Tax=Alectoria fallacina TaxID=1903189 RepID=A0A8H3FAR4_9LECA|nr:MAG: hypothetical protein ALECFALPRED_001659 [Alectoria fallacina]
MASLRTPLYREFLTPALHRRFTSAALITLVVCYAEAVLVADKCSIFWFWFPVGPAGIRTLLLFLSALSIFVLRVAQLHLGIRTTASPFETFTIYLFRLNTVQTLGWYLFSAWWFSEVYMWSVPESANLGWVAAGKAWERKRLNERPIYLRSVFFMLAILQSGSHLYYDYDSGSLPVTRAKTGASSGQPRKQEHPIFQMKALLPNLSRKTGIQAAGMAFWGPIIYTLFIRRAAWSLSLYFAALLWDVPASQLSYIPPYHYSLILRSFTSSVLLITLWEFSNAIFSTYLTQEPLKREQPLTSDSKDPNASLLNGLKAKRETVRTFAFCELALISQRFAARRKAIFADIDRPTGSAWNQIMTLCLGNILAISNRITEFQNPTTKSAVPPQRITIESLPSISSAPLRQESIFSNTRPPATTREKIESSVGIIAKSYGQSPQPAKPLKFLESQRAEGEKYLGVARQKLLTQSQQESLSSSGLLAQYNAYLIRFLQTPFGRPFRRTFKRRVSTVVLGSPVSELNSIIDSVNGLTALALASLTEDNYGKVAKDVPLLIQAFVSVIQSVEGFVKTLPVHWTDVEFSESDRRGEEVDLVVGSMKVGLKEMVDAFGKYATELGLTEMDIEAARRVAGVEADE